MSKLNRRSVLRGSVALAAAGTLGRPFIANAAATTATVWWPQGFVQEEDVASAPCRRYEKASGNKIELSIIPFAPAMQKIVAALTSGDVPDVMCHDTADQTVMPQNAWNDKLVDVSDVVETQKVAVHPTRCSRPRTTTTSPRSAAPTTCRFKAAVVPFHIWDSLVEKAGFKMEDIPKTWDAYLDFFKPMQKKLREQGKRSVYGLGLQVTANGPADGNNLFHHFLIAYGGNGIVTKDGKLHLDDPKVKEAAIKALTYIGHGLQGRLRAAGRDQLERRRRQQRLPRQADRDGRRRHDLDRGRDVHEKDESTTTS